MTTPKRLRPWRTVPEIVVSCAEHRPEQLVLLDPEGAGVSAAELLTRVRRGASALEQRGVRRGDLVAVDTTTLSWTDASSAYLAVVWLGAIAVMVTDAAAGRVAREKMGVAVAIGGDDRPDASPAVSGHVLPLRQLLASPQESESPAAVPSDRLDLVFTSGTTGDPKPVASTHGQWAPAIRPEIIASRSHRTVAHTGVPVGVSGGLHGVLLNHLARGVTSLWCPSAEVMCAVSARFGVSELHLPPHSARALTRLVPPAEAWAEGVRVIRVVGGPLPAKVAEDLAARFPRARVASLYGLTEGGAALCVRLVGSGTDDSIGRPAPGTEVRVLAPDGREVPPGQVGEVAMRAGEEASHYYREDALNRELFRDGWARTGDMGFVGPDGEVRLIGRAKELIFLRGGRVGPEAVEAVLARVVPDNVDLAVVGYPRSGDWDGIAVFLAGAEDDPAVVAASGALSQLRGPFRPSVVEVIDAIPRGPFGKTQRRLLGQRLADRVTSGAGGPMTGGQPRTLPT
jgi:long-chain acyl-CoA synthetase